MPNPTNDPEVKHTWTAEDLAQVEADLTSVEQELDMIAGNASNADLATRIRALSARIGRRRGFVREMRDQKRSFIPGSGEAAPAPAAKPAKPGHPTG